MLPVLPKETHSLLTRDRVRLDADVYRPDAPGEFPVLLMRQPYGRAIASTVVYAHPLWYAAQGYMVVIQDVRGRGTSEGEFRLFEQEIEDGYETVQWAAALPGSSGAVGMYGFSYQGMTQLYAAIARPPALKALCPAMLGYDLYQDWAYENGAFCLQANLGWAIQIAAETARLRGDAEAYRQLAIAAKNLPLMDSIPTQPEILKQLDPDSFYHTWLHAAAADEYWQRLSPKTYLNQLDLPMLHIGGWFDTFMRGTLQLYQAMTARSAYPQYLVVGPWAHLPWGRKVGALDLGVAANSPCDRLQVQWFDHWLKGKPSEIMTQPPVQLFVMGENQWRYFPAWDEATTAVGLHSTGRAAMDDQDGRLWLAPPDAPIPDVPIPDVIVHDPWRPVPAGGGHAAFPTGPQERSALDSRTDVLTYTSEPLPAPLDLIGEITLSLTCRADQPSFDVAAVLSEVRPNGTVFNLAQGYIHVPPGTPTTPLTFQIQPIAARIAAGHALRLSLSGAYFPAYPVNPGTGAIATTPLAAQQITTILIDPAGSQIHLPIRSPVS